MNRSYLPQDHLVLEVVAVCGVVNESTSLVIDANKLGVVPAC